MAFAMLTLVLLSTSAYADASTKWELTAQYGGKTEAVLAEGDRLYIAMGLNILIIDASDTKQLVLLGRSPLLPDTVQGISSAGEGMLAVSCGSGGLVMLDVRDVSNVHIVGVGHIKYSKLFSAGDDE